MTALAEIDKSPKCIFLYSVKNEDWSMALYLKLSKVSHRSALSKLRLSCHPLEVERGRYRRPMVDRESRFCPFCKTMVENEMHFLSVCPLYVDCRRKYGIDMLTNIEVINAFKSVDIAEHIRLASYVFESFNIREANGFR